MPNGGFNFGRSHNLKAISLIEAGRQEMDIRKRQQIYYELEKVLYDNYEDVWLWYPMKVWAYSKKIRGYNPDLHSKGLEGYWNTHCLWFADGE
jgi:ABC-type transport system substrate-binding protein